MSYERALSPESFFQTTIGGQLMPKIVISSENLLCERFLGSIKPKPKSRPSEKVKARLIKPLLKQELRPSLVSLGDQRMGIQSSGFIDSGLADEFHEGNINLRKISKGDS